VPAPELVTIGEAFEDLIFANLDRLPRPGEEIRTPTLVRTIGGGAVITAIAAARLGLRSRIVSALSASAATRLRRERVGVLNLKRRSEPHAVTAALSTAAERTFVTFDGVNTAIEPRLLESAGRARGRHVHLALCPKRFDRWITTLDILRARGISTSWDFGWDDRLLDDRLFPALLTRLDYVFFNEQEARLYSRRRSVRDAIARWRSHPHVVIVKVGDRGSWWVSGGRILHAAARRVRPIDTTGAGEAFNAGFLFARLRGCSPRRSLETGNYVGAMSTRAIGGIDGLPRRRELPSALRAGAS
jgi:sugar/nucleoside kinase (ribokinase family)